MKFKKTWRTKEPGFHWMLVYGKPQPRFVPATAIGTPLRFDNMTWVGDKIEVPCVEKQDTE